MTDEQKPQPKKSSMTRRVFLGALAAGGTGIAGLGTWLALPSTQRFIAFKGKNDFFDKPLEPIKDPTDPDYKLGGIVAETLTTEAGDTFLTWHSQELVPGKKTLVLFPGNGGHLGLSPERSPIGETGGNGRDYIELIKAAQKEGYQIMAVNHVGFAGSSTDAPTQEKIYQGAEKTIEWLLWEKKLQPKDLHIAGISLGSTVAAHAANHLSTYDEFTQHHDQDIKLTLINGLINIDAAYDVGAPGGIREYLKLVTQDRLDAGKELRDMGTVGGNRLKERIQVHYIRSLDDPHTPEGQEQLHETAAAGMSFTPELAEGGHFVKPSVILEAFRKMDPANQRVNETGRAAGRE